MALLSTNEILKINGKINTFVLHYSGSPDTNDVDLFVVIPPSDTRDPSHRAPVRSMTNLCNTCRSALEYLSYYVQTRSEQGKDADKGLPSACLLHDGVDALQQGEDESCHLCVLLMSDLRTKRISLESTDKDLSRLHFALTHGAHPRSTDNYWNFLKLQLWPCSDHGTELFRSQSKDASSPFELSSSTDSQQTRDLAVEWLSVCQANEDGRHSQCNQATGDWLPTRLLDVDHARETGKLRLVQTGGHPEQFVSSKYYMTLSHCWGAWGSVTLPVLTVGNLSERQATGLDISLLPKTFKEALEVAEWFKCRWLWIDSLCIIQDSTEDWQREAVMMYSVYRSALLNISADDSNDARWGCFRNRDPLAVCPMRLRLGAEPGQQHASNTPSQNDHWLTPDSTRIFEAITKAPLAKRSWVFQERQLSRRILHFTSREVIWECCAEGPYFACETFPRGAPLPSLFGGRPKYQGQGRSLSSGAEDEEHKIYDTWDMLCQSYSEKKLSQLGDKTVALSGLAREFEALLPRDVYVAGMWRSLLPQGLLWRSADSSGRISSEVYIAPSWSWLSIDGPIADFAFRGTLFSVTEVLNVMTEPAIPSEPTASLRSAYLELRCYLRRVQIKPDHEAKPWYMMAIGGGKDHKLAIGDGGLEMEVGSFDPLRHRDTFTYSFDVPFTESSGPTSVSAYFLPVSVSGPDETSSTSINGLLVEPVDDNLTTFRRVGILSCHGLHCLSILYRKSQENTGAAGQWSKLKNLLGESYKSWESIRRESRLHERADDSRSVPLEDEEAPQDSNAGGGSEGQDLTTGTVPDDAVKIISNPAQVETENDHDRRATTPADTEIDKVGEGMKDLHVSRKDDAMEAPVPTVSWESFEALERLYASDGAFIGSELEQHFERMVARRIRLI